MPNTTDAVRTLASAMTDVLVDIGRASRNTTQPTWTSCASDGSQDVFVVLPYDDGKQPWAVGFRLVPPLSAGPGASSGEWRCTEFMVQQADSGQERGITGATVRAIPIGQLLARAREEASDRRRQQGDVGDDLDTWLAPWREDRRGKQARSDADYAWLALAYTKLVERGDRSPAVTLAHRIGVGSAATMVNRIGEARKRGMLSPVQRGEAGGSLTQKAFELLDVPPRQD